MGSGPLADSVGWVPSELQLQGRFAPVRPLAGTPGLLAGIKDRLHWVRDTGFDEDRSLIRTASGPRIMASLRNLASTILRLALGPMSRRSPEGCRLTVPAGMN